MDLSTVQDVYRGFSLHLTPSEQLEGWHGKVLDLLVGSVPEAVKRAKAIDPQLKADVRGFRQAELLQETRSKLSKKLDTLLEDARSWKATLVKRRDALVPRRPEDPLEAILQQLETGEIRRAILNLPTPERVTFALQAAERGDGIALRALSEWPVPLLPPGILERVTEAFLDTVAPQDLKESLATASMSLDEMERTLATAEQALGLAVATEPDVFKDWASARPQDLVRAWPEALKAAWVMKHGLPAWERMARTGEGYTTPTEILKDPLLALASKRPDDLEVVT